jgi:hypothetical protein
VTHYPPLARIPAKWNHFAEKDSRQINMLEQILIAKVCNFGGICSSHALDHKQSHYTSGNKLYVDMT